MRKTKGLTQAYAMQDLCYEAAQSLRRALTLKESESLPSGERILAVSKEDSQAISALVAAWDKAQDRVRIHRGKPLPGSLKPEGVTKRKPHSNANIVALDPVTTDAQVSQG